MTTIQATTIDNDKKHSTIVRLPPDLWEILQRSAEENFRSVAQEIHFRLVRDQKAQAAP
jgi:hypothetical protein